MPDPIPLGDRAAPRQPPAEQTAEQTDRLPRWTYFDEEFFALEQAELFRRSWLLVGHVNDLPRPGDYLTLDAAGESAIVLRDHSGALRAFHNICRHRGARLREAPAGRCEAALMCPFHGWTYALDGRLTSVPAEHTFAGLDKSRRGLAPVDLEIWMGFIFVRFDGAKDGLGVAERMQPVEEVFAAYRIADMAPLPGSAYRQIRPYNWKVIHDIDNEGYHIPIGHPALQQLCGAGYHDAEIGSENMSAAMSAAPFNDHPAGRPAANWSVRHYRRLLPDFEHLPPAYQNCWQYGMLFPSMIFGLYPDSIEFYMTIPLAPDKTLYRGARYGLPDARRETRLARWLCRRINLHIDREDEAFVRRLQAGMRSSAFPEPMLSALEAGVRQWHNQVQDILPAARLKQHPGPGQVAAANAALQRHQKKNAARRGG